MFDPNKNNPKIIDIDKLKLGLSLKQREKIAYECELLRISIDELIKRAPFLFNDGVTAANTAVVERETPKWLASSDEEEFYSIFGD